MSEDVERARTSCMTFMESIASSSKPQTIDLPALVAPAVKYLKHMQQEEDVISEKISTIKHQLSQTNLLDIVQRQDLQEELHKSQLALYASQQQITATKSHITSLATLSLEGKNDFGEFMAKITSMNHIHSTQIPNLTALAIKSEPLVVAAMKAIQDGGENTTILSDELLENLKNIMSLVKSLNSTLSSYYGQAETLQMFGEALRAALTNGHIFLKPNNSLKDLNKLATYLLIIQKELSHLKREIRSHAGHDTDALITKYFCNNVPEDLLQYCDTSKVALIFSHLNPH